MLAADVRACGPTRYHCIEVVCRPYLSESQVDSHVNFELDR